MAGNIQEPDHPVQKIIRGGELQCFNAFAMSGIASGA
jgi:hypothetical protein